MSEHIRIMRAYRPSHLVMPTQEDVEDSRLQKERNLRVYAERALKGLPIFEDSAPTKVEGYLRQA